MGMCCVNFRKESILKVVIFQEFQVKGAQSHTAKNITMSLNFKAISVASFLLDPQLASKPKHRDLLVMKALPYLMFIPLALIN